VIYREEGKRRHSNYNCDSDELASDWREFSELGAGDEEGEQTYSDPAVCVFSLFSFLPTSYT
jgi:hypothetical protein